MNKEGSISEQEIELIRDKLRWENDIEERVEKARKIMDSLETDVNSLSTKIFWDNARIFGIITIYLWTKFFLF